VCFSELRVFGNISLVFSCFEPLVDQYPQITSILEFKLIGTIFLLEKRILINKIVPQTRDPSEEASFDML